jgi:hypothetical protein
VLPNESDEAKKDRIFNPVLTAQKPVAAKLVHNRATSSRDGGTTEQKQ